jgi:hypothetical protein
MVTNALSDKRENVTFGKDQGNVGGTFVLNDKNMNKFNGSPVKGKYDDVVLSAHLDDVLNLPGFNFKKVIVLPKGDIFSLVRKGICNHGDYIFEPVRCY